MSRSFLSTGQSVRELSDVEMDRISGGHDPCESYLCAQQPNGKWVCEKKIEC